MADTLAHYKVFIASPGGLDDIREAFKQTLFSYNDSDANHRGVHFSPIGWDLTLGGVGRPQALINEDIKKCDHFVLVLHDRWGTPPSAGDSSSYTSGTEEEFHIATQCNRDRAFSMQSITLFFKAINERQLSDPGEQLSRVLKFKKEREESKDMLFYTFDSPNKFTELLQRHLSKWVREHESKSSLRETALQSNLSEAFDINDFHMSNAESDTTVELVRIDELISQGKMVEAEEIFSNLVAKDSGNSQITAEYGKFLRKLGLFDRARTLLSQAISKASKPLKLDVMAFATSQLGKLEEEAGNLQDGIDMFRESFTSYKLVGDKIGMANSAKALGKVLKKFGMLEEAEHELSRAKALYESIGDNAGLASSLGYLGLVLKSRGRFADAELVQRQALKIHQDNKNTEGIIIVLGNLGASLRLQGKLNEAIPLHEEALAFYRKSNELRGVARELTNLATAYRILGRLDEAKAYCLEALTIAEDRGDQSGVSIQYGCLGLIAFAEDKFDEAEQFFSKALVIDQKLGKKQGQAMQYRNLSKVYRISGYYDKAEKVIMLALKIDSESKLKFGIGKSRVELAMVFLAQKKIDQAIPQLRDALQLFLESENKNEIQEVQHILSLVESNEIEKLSEYALKIGTS
ncbi:tetratricopeptide repeat protein [Undibacterium sp. Ji42W]|uniref:tetratricopeptide repeat protein n=1 Tax=Undibacterium sp. Ji42W TaxID=3413039 RepID=UPI003BF0E981